MTLLEWFESLFDIDGATPVNASITQSSMTPVTPVSQPVAPATTTQPVTTVKSEQKKDAKPVTKKPANNPATSTRVRPTRRVAHKPAVNKRPVAKSSCSYYSKKPCNEKNTATAKPAVKKPLPTKTSSNARLVALRNARLEALRKKYSFIKPKTATTAKAKPATVKPVSVRKPIVTPKTTSRASRLAALKKRYSFIK